MQKALKGAEHLAIDGAVSIMNAQPTGAATINTSNIHGSDSHRHTGGSISLNKIEPVLH